MELEIANEKLKSSTVKLKSTKHVFFVKSSNIFFFNKRLTITEEI